MNREYAISNLYSKPHEEEGMQKLLGASILLLFFVVVQTNAFAGTYKCEFKDGGISGINSIHMTESVLTINNSLDIAIEESRIRCANFGKQKRFDGIDDVEQLRIVLKTCTSDAAMEGHLIDARQNKAAEVFCDKI